jgi:hypothetical protein
MTRPTSRANRRRFLTRSAAPSCLRTSMRARQGWLLLALAGCGAQESGDTGDGSSETGATGSSTLGEDSEGSGSSASSSNATSSSSAESSSSSGSAEESSSSSGAPVDLVPVFIALGDGGWTASSCDRGLTWTTNAFSDQVGDHTQWTAFGGLAHLGDAFVAGTGWGGEGGHILHSLDGRAWEDLPASSFVEDGIEVGYAMYTSGVASTGSELIIFSQRVWRSTDGTNWTAIDMSLPPGSEQLRQLRGFPDEGVLVASVESQSGTNHPMGNFVVVSEDAGMNWIEGTGYVPECSNAIQHWGDIEMMGDTILVGTGDVCRSPDRGATWELVASPTGGEIQDLFRDDAGFLAVSGSLVFRSDDGSEWTQLGDAGVPLRAAAWADGVYAAVAGNGSTLLWSDDAVTWTAGEIDSPPTAEIWVRDFIGVAVEGACR